MSHSIFRHANSFLLLAALLPVLLSLENPLMVIPGANGRAFPESSRFELNQPPVAVNDSIQVHGGTQLNIMANDSDPDPNDSIFFDRIGDYPQHGGFFGPNSSSPFYIPNSGYVGSDTFTYRIQDGTGAFSSFATVTLDVRNNAPTPGSHSFEVHGLTFFGTLNDLIATDSDSDGDSISFDSIQTFPQHGTLTTLFRTFPGYTPDLGYTGPDNFTYKICDDLGLCSIATVTLDVRNNAPVGGTRVYTAHGLTLFGTLNDLMATDSDPDGDPISFDSIQTQPEHGTLTTQFQQFPGYTPDLGYTGRDSFTYRICDNLGLCAPNVVSLDVVNKAPTPGRHEYGVRGLTLFGTLNDLMKGDTDPDGDPISFDSIQTYPQHGSLTNAFLQFPGYNPAPGFAGTDSFTYKFCDHLGKCAIATVTLHLPSEGENDGRSCPAVGGPINPTSGNMYVQQGDYQLPSVGFGINLSRTYNSNSQRVGLFGRGWSTEFDDSIGAYDASLLRFNQSDGRAVYFGRPVGSSDVFTDLVGDFNAQVSQNAGDFTLTAKDGSSEQFNTAGKLISVTDRNGNTTSLSYDGNGFLAAVTDPFGRVLTVTTNANGQVTSISDTMGTVATYTYGNSDELLSVTYADNSAFNFAYDGNLRLTTVRDALGNIIESHTYDSEGRAVTSERHGGIERYSLSYVSDNETHVTDALGHVTKYTFDKSKGRNVVTRVEGVCGCGGGAQVQTWTYDNQLNVTSTTDALGRVISYTYDSNGNRLTETDPTGTVTYTYNEFAEVLTRTDQLNFVSTNTYDGQGNPVSTIDARGKTTNFVNDARGLLLSVTDARGKATRFAYDSAGNLITRTDALSHDARFAYDARGRLTSMTNALGHVTAFSYDGFGRVNKITQADGTTVAYEYDLAGRRTAMTDAKGSRATFAYDAASRLTSQTDALNQTASFGYDVMSNLTSVTDALSRVTTYEYDDFNRLVKITHAPATVGAIPLFETLTYDAGGNVTQRTDTAGRVNAYAYDNVNRVTSTTDADNKTTSFEYDALSRMTALVDPIGQRYRFNYNAVGMVTHARRGSDVLSFTYDAVGNRKTRTDYNGALTEYDYDALNRLKTISYPDTTTVDYTYDRLSRLQTATNENGTVNFDYNKMSRVTSVMDVFGQVVDYNYDANGNRTRLSLNSALVETYRYDALDRLTKILDAAGAVFTFDYDPVSRLTQKKAPNGVKTTYQYDGLDRLTRLLDTKGVNTIADRQYQYNNASQITQITEPASTKSYGYDALDRLTSANYNNPLQPNESYAYDGVGNRMNSQFSASYTYQRFNRLTTTSSATYAYDSNGNLVSKTEAAGTTQYVWDFENRLKQATLPTGTTVSYKYDALGRRIQRAPSTGVSTNFVYDGQDVVKDLNSDGSTVEYLNGPGIDNKLRLTDSRLTAQGPLYFVQDHLGSTTALANVNGVVVSQVAYDAFGNSSGNSFTRYEFTGRERDPDTGLLHYRARWYDPQLGRFLSEDPIGLRGGINSYQYVRNNPIRFTDPLGLEVVETILGISAHIAAGFGDTLTGGIAQSIAQGIRMGGTPAYLPEGFSPTAYIRSFTPGGKVVDPCSGWYQAGVGGAVAWSLTMAGAGAASAAAEGAATSGIARTSGSGTLLGSGGANNSTGLSTLRMTTAGETFFHYGYAADANLFATGLRPGAYATNVEGLSGMQAQAGLALPRTVPPNAIYRVTPGAGTLIEVNPITRPLGMQPGGLSEYYFIQGTSPGTVSGPLPTGPK